MSEIHSAMADHSETASSVVDSEEYHAGGEEEEEEQGEDFEDEDDADGAGEGDAAKEIALERSREAMVALLKDPTEKRK